MKQVSRLTCRSFQLDGGAGHVPFVLYVGLHDIPAALEDATFLKHSQQQSRRFSAVHGRLAPDYFMA